MTTVERPIVVRVLTNWNRKCDKFAGVGGYGRNGHGQDDARTGTDPQEVFDRQQRCDAETGRFVLSDNVIATYGKGEKYGVGGKMPFIVLHTHRVQEYRENRSPRTRVMRAEVG